jgi:hypothetical protein
MPRTAMTRDTMSDDRKLPSALTVVGAAFMRPRLATGIGRSKVTAGGVSRRLALHRHCAH